MSEVLISDIIIKEDRRAVKSEYVQKLADSIKQVGLINPITIAPDNRLIAGYHRLQAFIQLGETRIPAVVLNLSELEARLAEIDENLIRNEGTVLERSDWLKERQAIYEKLYPDTRRGVAGALAKHGLATPDSGVAFTTDTANKTGKSKSTIKEEIQIARDIAPEVKEKIRDTELADRKTDLLRLSRMEPEQQEKIVDQIISGKADTLNHARKNIAAEAVKDAPELSGKFRVIYADPPWSYGGSMNETYGTADKHYPTMSLDDLCIMPVPDITEDNAVLFLWVTSPLLEDAFKVINAWGFKYKASFVWDKVKHVMGHYNSVRHELLLICTKGSCVPENMKLFDSVYEEERTEHSKKPEFFREVIDTIYPSGKRIELFARREVEGWETYGNQLL
ncbi:MAG: ParB N-terminal domain-containing protein [Bacteroidales bacterium]|nr:ParB N-terminal domain-containing protein [Bacteroidales bacterium]